MYRWKARKPGNFPNCETMQYGYSVSYCTRYRKCTVIFDSTAYSNLHSNHTVQFHSLDNCRVRELSNDILFMTAGTRNIWVKLIFTGQYALKFESFKFQCITVL